MSGRGVPAAGLNRIVSELDQGARLRLLQELRLRNQARAWFVEPAASMTGSERVELFCFPYAGSGASSYAGWGRAAALQGVRVVPVQLPGRENRTSLPPRRNLSNLVTELVGVLSQRISGPFAFFGHSMGALLAFEVAHALGEQGLPKPAHLFLSAFRAAHLDSEYIRIHHLPDEVLKIVLEKDGIAPAILTNADLMSALLPILRADLELCDTYEYADRPPLSLPITAFGGDEDVRVSRAQLSQWDRHTSESFDLVTFPGDHFFIHSAGDRMVAEVGRRLSPAAGLCQRGGVA